MVRFENVEIRYRGKEAILTDVSFDLGEGNFHFLTGKSGAGKSSLLKAIYLGIFPSKGKINLFGRDTSSITKKEILDQIEKTHDKIHPLLKYQDDTKQMEV
mgnify:CR=1 FL=1